MFDQPCQRGHLPLNPETLTIGNKPVTISGDPSKQPNEHIKTMLKNISTTITQEACGRAINNITGFKGIKPATVNIAASLPDELNTFYARFEAVALTPIFSKCFEKLVRDYICSVLPASLDPLQFCIPQ